MTNEVLAENAEEFANAFHNESDKAILREAAARLRNVTVRSDNSAVIAELQRRLKVAEDALKDALEHVEIRKNNEYDDSEVVAACDSTIAKCNNALAAIREEGSAS